MIDCTILGGPLDGAIVSLRSCRPIYVEVLADLTWQRQAETINERTHVLTPRLTRRGWVLPWPKQ